MVLNDVTFTIPQNLRIGIQRLLPAVVNPQNMTQNIIQNSNISTTTVSLATGLLVTLTTTFTGINTNARIAATQFMVDIFQGSVSTANEIPVVNPSKYVVSGPYCLPQIYSQTTSNNILYKTFVFNNTGSTQTIIFKTELRFINSMAGSSQS